MKHTPHTLAREVAETPKETVFYGSFWLGFALIAIGSFLGITVMLATLPWFDNPFFVHLIAYIIAMIIVGLPGARFLSWYCRARVKSEGIHGGTFWGTPVYMSFGEMQSVKQTSMIGLRYLRVTSFRENCPPLWLPLFLAKPEAFREHISGLTAPTNPLRRSLESGNSAQKREPLPLSR